MLTMVSRQSMEEHKSNRMELIMENHFRYANKGEGMINGIVTGDKIWIHHYQLESKEALMISKPPSSPSKPKVKVVPSTGQYILILFSDSQGVFIVHFLKQGETVTADSYSKILDQNEEYIIQ